MPKDRRSSIAFIIICHPSSEKVVDKGLFISERPDRLERLERQERPEWLDWHMNFEKKKPETNHLRLSLQPLTVATSRSWRGWVAAGSTESVSGKNKKTERGGFEPPKAFDLTRLPIVHLRPLGHLSNSTANYIRKAFDSSSSATLLL